MKRVTSRQRLVSWDAFDATTKSHQHQHHDNSYSSTSDEEYSDYDRPTSSELAICRKRERAHRESKGGPAVISSFDWELSSSAAASTLTATATLDLDDLAQDVHLHIFSFLDVSELGNVMSLNNKFRQILLSEDANIIWLQHCQKHWSHLAPIMDLHSKVADGLHIPTAAGNYESHGVNLRLLFSMTPSEYPTQIDKSLLGKSKFSSSRRVYHFNRVEAYTDKKTGETLVRYNGPVGSGDRCIRSDHPLPKPTSRILWKDHASEKTSLLDLLCRGAKAVAKCGFSQYRPFVSPYVNQDGSIQATPRMVAYFEVSILNKDDDDDVDANDSLPPPLVPFRSSRRAECTAIGVADKSFHMHSRMPGWDGHSYGYHGDDGGIYHSSGGMIDRFGPTFGAGDTVGCGVDYVTQGIFYTLNGKFLGYAFRGIDRQVLQNDLYPVVGIDTNSPISVNFGQKPFAFTDLKEFDQKHAMFCPYHRFNTSTTNGTMTATTATKMIKTISTQS